MRSATSFWNISVSESHQGGQAAAASASRSAAACRYCRAGWRRSCTGSPGASGATDRPPAHRRRPPRAGPDNAPRSRPAPAGSARRARSRRRGRAPCASSARVRPPGPGPDLDDRVVRRAAPAARAILPVRLRSSRKFWPSDFFGRQAVALDHLAQRRQAVDAGSCGVCRAPPCCAASRSAAIRLSGRAMPVPAMSKAVPWSGEVRTKGRPSVTLTPRRRRAS